MDTEPDFHFLCKRVVDSYPRIWIEKNNEGRELRAMKTTLTRRELAKSALVLASLGLGLSACSNSSDDSDSPSNNTPEKRSTYSLVQNVYNWGSSYSKVVIPVPSPSSLDYLTGSSYQVEIERFDSEGNAINSGSRTVQAVYRSDEEGNPSVDGNYVSLSMGVGASASLASPYYSMPNGLKAWARNKYTITNTITGDTWDTEDTVYHPDEKGFDTNVYEGVDKEIPYASCTPEDDGSKHPLIVWFHGFGSGGTDIAFVTGGMKVTNFITKEIQDIFGGAYILLPQADTMWMDSGNGEYTTDGSSIFSHDLMALIESYVADHSSIDTSRIYLGGCSNGGYMTIELARQKPDYFAATFPVCEAYESTWLSDDDIRALADIPTWFVQSELDPVVDPTQTTIPTYQRLLEAGAENLHFTLLDRIADPEYGNEYNAHFAWVYALENLCTTDYDGTPVMVSGEEASLYQWVANQAK